MQIVIGFTKRLAVDGTPANSRSAPVGLRPSLLCLAIALCIVMFAAAPAAEFHLRSEVYSTGPVVTLADVAEIVTADLQKAATLGAIELFAAPPSGQRRFVRLREIQDILMMRGVSLLEHRFSGVSQVAVNGDRPHTPSPALSTIATERAEQKVVDAVCYYLKQHVSDAEPWSVEVHLDESQVRQVTATGADLSISGGTQPWIGRQRFEVTVSPSDASAGFTVDATVNLPPAVVVAARPLARGAVVGLNDVKLERPDRADAVPDAIVSLDEVLGKETTRSIPAGITLTAASVRSPILVRRSDVVTVYVRSAGIRVRSLARAREDGSLDDLIAVESLATRKTFLGRVSGIEEVEVYARAIRAESPQPAPVRVAGQATTSQYTRSR